MSFRVADSVFKLVHDVDEAAWTQELLSRTDQDGFRISEPRSTPDGGWVHLVHADLSGNVFLDRADAPVILDISPCLRPRRWAVAIVIADAVLWSAADVALAESFSSNPIDRDLLGRALMFRMVAEQLETPGEVERCSRPTADS